MHSSDVVISYNVSWCMLEGSRGSVEVSELEPVTEGTFAVVGDDGATVTAA